MATASDSQLQGERAPSHPKLTPATAPLAPELPGDGPELTVKPQTPLDVQTLVQALGLGHARQNLDIMR